MPIPFVSKLVKGFTGTGGLIDAADAELQVDGFSGTLSSLQSGASVQAMAAIIDGFMIDGGTPGMVSAEMVSYSPGDPNGLLSTSDDVKEALDLISRTGLGSPPVVIRGSFFANYAADAQGTPTGNQGIWFGDRQTGLIEVEEAAGQSRGRYTFRLPDIDDWNEMFDRLAALGLPEVYTRTISYIGGNTANVAVNALTVAPASVSPLFDRNEFPVTLAQGSSVTIRVVRVGGAIQPLQRVSVQQGGDPIAVFGSLVFQNLSWNNRDNSFLPSGAQVQKGYAFPVIGSNPDDGTLRQGLLDAGVSDRRIFDGDYVVWTADAFTSWADGDNWGVLSLDDIRRFSRAASNFDVQISEIDRRVDVAPVSMLTNDALVWLFENPPAAAPFLTPSTDPNNPRSGDDYPYVGGRENRNAQGQFQVGTNRFNNYPVIGITPNFISGHNPRDIEIRLYDTDRNLIENWNLEDDFTFRNDGDFTNGTVRHYTRNTSVNYPFLATIEIWLTQVQRHFRLNANSVDVTQNVFDLPEQRLSASVQEKLNRAIPDQGVTYAEIEDRLEPIISVTHSEPDPSARFATYDGTGAYPTQLSDFTQVPANNPQFTNNNTGMFVATVQPHLYVLKNVTADTVTPLMQGQPGVDVIESFTEGGVTYFVYLLTGLTSGHVFEVERTTVEQVGAWTNELANHQEALDRIDAELEHAALSLPDAVIDVLDNNTSVTEESTPTVNPTTYNNQLSGASSTTQSVFYEPNENAGSGGLKNSRPLSELSGDQVRRKLLYIPPGQPANQASYITAFDGTTGRDLISYVNGSYVVNVRVPGQPASTITDTIYPAPATRVSGPGIWQTISALTFQNGIPVPLADELFFTRNIPTASTTVTIDYRGHANGNLFGTGQATLTGVGGPVETFANFTLNDGNEQAFVEARYYPNRNGDGQHEIRVSVTERVNTGLPTINDIQVILSYTETRTVPATTGTTRQVEIEGTNVDGWQVFAFKPGSNGNLFISGDRAEIDTNRTYETYFGAGLGGHISVADENARFFNYEDFEPIPSVVQSLEDHATLPQFGLFSTTYTHETVLAFDVALRAENSQGDAVNLGEELVLVAPNNSRWRLSVDASGNLSTAQVT